MGDLKSAIRYYYDENGNTTAEQKSVYTTTGTQSSNMSMSGHSGGSTMKLYRYDEFNRLIKYNDDGTEAKYTYGVDNLRATKTVNGTTTSYVWNGQNLASETKNDTTTVYYYDPLGVNGAKTDNDTFVRYIKDPHGNVVATSKNNALFGTYDYTAFGNQLEATDTTTPFRYCSEYYDEESGLTYLRNRYYNSNTGRFISEDPVKDGTNWYVYCDSNTISYIDPLGLDKELDDYINEYYSGQMTLTIAIKRPVPNSREVADVTDDGSLENGHSFIRLDGGEGDVLYRGFAPTEKHLLNMLFALDTPGEFIDDSYSDWNVAKVYVINDVDEYNRIISYLNDTLDNYPDYNIKSNNCTTFAVNVYRHLNPFYNRMMPILEHKWTLPYDLYNKLENYSARGIIPTWLATEGVATLMGNFYGYTPADAAQDLKGASGTVLLKYANSNGVREINNWGW